VVDMAFTALSWNKLTSNTSTVTVSIPGGYFDYRLYFSIKGTDASERQLLMTANGVSSGYTSRIVYADGAQITEIQNGTSGNSPSSNMIAGLVPGSDGAKPWLAYEGFVNFFANSLSVRKAWEFTGAYENNVSSGSVKTIFGSANSNSNAAITSLTFSLSAGSIASGSTFALFGATQV
jgi:hypothetical protein